MSGVYTEFFVGCQVEKDKWLKDMWKEFADVPVNPETECIEEDWGDWKAGTFREEIWHWFDEHYSKGVVYLMYGESCREKICKRCGSQVQEEKDAELAKEYPYYRPNCDENMYSFECREA